MPLNQWNDQFLYPCKKDGDRMKKEALFTRKYREHLLDDAYRPAYHFAICDDCGFPGDPNGAFFADGGDHLMYLYRNSEADGHHWGHLSSVDLFLAASSRCADAV